MLLVLVFLGKKIPVNFGGSEKLELHIYSFISGKGSEFTDIKFTSLIYWGVSFDWTDKNQTILTWLEKLSKVYNFTFSNLNDWDQMVEGG